MIEEIDPIWGDDAKTSGTGGGTAPKSREGLYTSPIANCALSALHGLGGLRYAVVEVQAAAMTTRTARLVESVIFRMTILWLIDDCETVMVETGHQHHARNATFR